MTSTRALTILLRVVGASALFALVAVMMPMSWMTATHRWLGLGEMPTEPVVEYLSRSLSVFYALFGALCLVLAGDVERHRSVLEFLGMLIALAGVALGGIDLAAGMPWLWTLSEGPLTTGFGLLTLFLARRGRP